MFKFVNTARWCSPKMQRLSPFYPPNADRERKVNEIVSQLEQNNLYLRSAANEKFQNWTGLQQLLCSGRKKTASVAQEKYTDSSLQQNDFAAGKLEKYDDICDNSRETDIRREPTPDEVIELDSKHREPKSRAEINVLEEKYFMKWLRITRRNIAQKAADFRKHIFNRDILQPVDLEEQQWKKWRQIENEIKEMKSILFLNWTSPNNADYSFEHSRYLKEYKRNPFKWTDSTYYKSSGNTKIESLQRWMQIEEIYKKVQDKFFTLDSG